MHRRILIDKKTDSHGGATSLYVPTGVPVNGFGTGQSTENSATPVNFLQGNRRNRPEVKHGKDDGAIQPFGTSFPPY